MTDDPRPPRAMREFPRLRYMGSRYRLVPYLAQVFTELGGATVLDAFSGSGVVSYLRPAPRRLRVPIH